jgi:rfaE bifunctional protein kinase chain/domain
MGMADQDWLEACLSGISAANVAVFGDFCVDAYWDYDARDAEVSVETGLPIRRVREQRYSLGGAGNVAANLAALGVRRVSVVGVVGQDAFGEQLMRMLAEQEIDAQSMVRSQPDWQTHVYGKPMDRDREDSRLDFGAFNALAEETLCAAVEQLNKAASECNVVVLNQQLPAGVCTAVAIDRINQVVARHPKTTFIVDARHRAGLFRGCVLKLNGAEAARLLGENESPGTSAAAKFLASKLARQIGQPVFLTRGEAGMVVAHGDQVHDLPGIQVIERVDPVGAGDTAVAALAAALASGQPPVAAARFANIAASITVRKLCITGVATPAEIRAVGPSPDYVYHTDLAADARHARYVPNTEFEVVSPLPAKLQIRHAIFDHDGTISTLRQGWEQIMEPVMIESILGEKFKDVSQAVLARVTHAARELIDKTTGIQTLVQMQELVKLVREFGFVPAESVLNEHGYKMVYNVRLLDMIKTRVEKLNRGELESADFQVKNAEKLIRHLHSRGVKLYLASGTDEPDVVAEATAMGYADVFEGRIYGAVGDVNVEAKRLVLERIIRENALSGHEFVTFGDGPVEIRETRKRDGICIGVCSDEVRGFGFNSAKRGRLIRAGASLLVPDFSQLPQLLTLLQLT